MAITEYKTNKLTLTKSFSSLILTTFCPEKLDVCGAACVYIVIDLMTELKLRDNNALRSDDGSEDD